jgi:hypothetical protein
MVRDREIGLLCRANVLFEDATLAWDRAGKTMHGRQVRRPLKRQRIAGNRK